MLYYNFWEKKHSFPGTISNETAEYRACRCLHNFYRLDRFGPCSACPPYGFFFVRKIQQYLLLTTSGNGRTSLKKSVSRVLSTIFILLDQTTTNRIPRSIIHFRSHLNVPMQSPARVELTQNAIKDIKGLCVQPALKASIFASTLVWNVPGYL